MSSEAGSKPEGQKETDDLGTELNPGVGEMEGDMAKDAKSPTPSDGEESELSERGGNDEKSEQDKAIVGLADELKQMQREYASMQEAWRREKAMFQERVDSLEHKLKLESEELPENVSDRRTKRKSLKIGSKQVSLDSQDDEGVISQVVLKTLPSGGIDFPKIGKEKTGEILLSDLISLEDEYQQYKEDCGRRDIEPDPIRLCFTLMGAKIFRTGYLNKPEGYQITDEDVEREIRSAKGNFAKDHGSAVFDTLPKALKGSWKLGKDYSWKSQRANLFGAMRLHFKENGKSEYIKSLPSEPSEQQKKEYRDNRRRRGEVIKMMIKEVKPAALAEELRREIQLDATAQYDLDGLFDRIGTKAEEFQMVHLAKERIKDQRASTAANASRPQATSRDKMKKPWTTKFDKCVGCNQHGHNFLFYSKQKKKYIQNCNKDYSDERFVVLKEQELKAREKRKEQRNLAKENKELKARVAALEGTSTESDESAVQPDLTETIATLAKEVSKLKKRNKREKAARRVNALKPQIELLESSSDEE